MPAGTGFQPFAQFSPFSQDFRQHFRLKEGLIYLNSGSHSITPTRVMKAMQELQNSYELNPTLGLIRAWNEGLWRAQTRLAGFFGADPRDLFLRSNVTEVMNEFVMGTPLPRDSEIAYTDLEYGAIVNLIKFRAQRDSLSERVIRLPADLRPRGPKPLADLLLDSIVSQFTPRTRLFVCSDIITHNGLLLPIDAIARETRRRGILLAIDGAHGPGSLNLDFRRMGDVDFYGGNLHKWMMGPKGTSFGWVNPARQAELPPRLAGWTPFENPPPFAGFGGGSRFASKMLMVGCVDFAPFLALESLIDFWEELGPARVRERIYALQSDLEQKVESGLGLEPLSPEAGSERGPLLSFELPEKLRGDWLPLLNRIVLKHQLQISIPMMRGHPVLRLSPHIYNTPEEHTRAVEILKEVFS